MWQENVDPTLTYTYDSEDRIGEGTYSKVYKAVRRSDQQVVALKRSRESTNEGVIKHILNEMNIFRNLHHPNVMTLVECYSFEGDINFVMPYYQQSLYDKLDLCKKQGDTVPSDQIREWMRDILLALDYMHSNGFIHRDICPKNMMVTDTNNIVICDFSLTRYVGALGSDVFLEPEVQKLWYRAPELLKEEQYDYRVDIWAAACTMLHMINLSPVLTHDSEKELLDREKDLFDKPGNDGIQILSRRNLLPPTKKLLTDMMKFDYNKRPYAHQLLSYDYFGDRKKLPDNESMDSRNLRMLGERQRPWTAYLDRDDLYLWLLESRAKDANMDRLYTVVFLLNQLPSDEWNCPSQNYKTDPYIEAANNFYRRIADIDDPADDSQNKVTVAAEWKILRRINFNTQIPTPSMFLRIYLRAVPQRNLKQSVTALCCVSLFGGLLRYHTIQVAASILWLALRLNRSNLNDEEFQRITGVHPKKIMDCIYDFCRTIEDNLPDKLWQHKKIIFTPEQREQIREFLTHQTPTK
jgi:serine/threonine protein kinase